MITQAEFDSSYITAQEICKSLQVCRSSISQARKRGLLPAPIVVGGSGAGAQVHLWERTVVNEALSAWKLILDVRRSNKAVSA